MPGAAWRQRLVLLTVMVAALLAAFLPTYADMVRIWSTSSTFNHGFLIVPIALYLGSRRRADLAGIAPGVSVWGVVFTFGNVVLWIGGELMSVAFFKHLAVTGMLIGVSWALIGNRPFRVLLFPFLYLYFAVPEGEFLVPYLQDWTALVLVKMLRITGIPVFIEGRYLSIPSGNFVVAEACSGINYLIATLAVGAMFMYLNFVAWWRRVAFMIFAVMVPLVANGLRAYGIVMIAHLSDYRYAMGVDHFIYGWVFFGIVIFTLFAIGSLFSDVEQAPARRPAAAAALPARSGNAALVAALLVAAVLVPRVLLALSDSAREPLPQPSLPAIAGWHGPLPAEPRLGTVFPGADGHLSGRYTRPDGAVVWLEALYFHRDDGKGEVVNQSNSLFDDALWKQIAYRTNKPPSGSVAGDVYELDLRAVGSGHEIKVWQWYDVAGVRSARRLPIKLAQALARLRGAPAGGVAVLLSTPLAEQGAARQALAEFSHDASLAMTGGALQGSGGE